MKTIFYAVLIGLASSGLAGSAFAQDLAVKVSIVTHDDGSRTETKMDPTTHTSEQKILTIHDKLLKRVVYDLDENNQPVNGVIYGPNGQPQRKIVYRYDALNRLSEEQDYSMTDKFLGKFVYEYGKAGNISNIRSYDASGTELNPSGKKSTRQH